MDILQIPASSVVKNVKSPAAKKSVSSFFLFPDLIVSVGWETRGDSLLASLGTSDLWNPLWDFYSHELVSSNQSFLLDPRF